MKSKTIRGYLLTGLVVWLPIIITVVVLHFIVDLLDQTVSLLPQSYHPKQLIGYNIPGLGVIISLLLLFFTGILATNFFGQLLVKWGESILARIPLVRSIYSAAKQVLSAILSTNSQAFREVLLIEYPRKGSWSIGFQTGIANPSISQGANEELVSAFIPTTPNPTSGFIILVPKKEVIKLDMSIDEALKYVISLGVMQPGVVPEAIQAEPTNNH